MATVPKASRRPEAPDPASGAAAAPGVVLKDIVPDDPGERRKRNRLYALRALERLGLLGEENLLPTLARRPELRWLADEEGARWEVLAELGRIREPEPFEEAVGWVLAARPRTGEANIRLRRFRADAKKPRGAPRAGPA